MILGSDNVFLIILPRCLYQSLLRFICMQINWNSWFSLVEKMVVGLSTHPNIDSPMIDESKIKWADGVMLICGGVGFMAVDLRYFPS